MNDQGKIVAYGITPRNTLAPLQAGDWAGQNPFDIVEYTAPVTVDSNVAGSAVILAAPAPGTAHYVKSIIISFEDLTSAGNPWTMPTPFTNILGITISGASWSIAFASQGEVMAFTGAGVVAGSARVLYGAKIEVNAFVTAGDFEIISDGTGVTTPSRWHCRALYATGPV